MVFIDRYNAIYKADLISKEGKRYPSYLLTTEEMNKEIEESKYTNAEDREIDLTGDLCYNEFPYERMENREFVQNINSLKDLYEFLKDIDGHNYFADYKKYMLNYGLLVGGSKDEAVMLDLSLDRDYIWDIVQTEHNAKIRQNKDFDFEEEIER